MPDDRWSLGKKPDAAEYDNAQVTGAPNPSEYGYHHGPIVNANIDWVPPSRAAAIAAGRDKYHCLTDAENSKAPNVGARLSSVTTGVCDIVVNGNQLCGKKFELFELFVGYQ